MNLQTAVAYFEAIHPGVVLEREVDPLVMKLLGPAAILADLEGCDVVVNMAMHRVTADHECTQAFEPVNASKLDQLFKGTIDLQRRIEARISQFVEDAVRRKRRIRPFQHREHQMLIPGQPKSCNFA